MKRKVVTGLLVATMAMSMVGCGAKEEAAPAAASSAASEADETETAEAADLLYTVGYCNLADSDENCYIAASTFKEIVESDDFTNAVGHKVSVEWADSDGDISKQTNNVESLIAKGIDALFMPGVDTAGNSAAVEACNKAGIPVFMVASESEGGEWRFIGFNEHDCGYVQGQYIVDNAEDGDKIFYIQGTAGREAAVQREEGFREALEARPDLEIVSAQDGDFSTETAMQVTEDWIQAYGDDINWIATADNKEEQGAIEALKAANMLDKVRISGWIVPGTWDAQYLKDGDIEQAVYVSFKTLGETAASVCQSFYTGDTIEDKTYMDLFSVTKDNYSEYFE